MTDPTTQRAATLLLVEDDEEVRVLLSHALGAEGYLVDAVETGEQAVERLQSAPPELALLDLQLPGMSGMEVLAAARRHAPTTQCIMLTGYGSVDRAIEAMRLGAFDFLNKPVTLEKLKQVVRWALRARDLYAPAAPAAPPRTSEQRLSELAASAQGEPPRGGAELEAARLLALLAEQDAWPLERLEREYILAVLRRVSGHQERAAALLGLERRDLYHKLKRYWQQSAGVPAHA